jgi:prophage tail gpP-like protein
MSNEVSLTINGKRYLGWQEVSIRRSIETFAGSFDMSLVDSWKGKEAFEVKPEMACTVYIGRDLLIKGFVDEVSVDVGSSNHSLKVRGRCRSADLIDCSCLHKPGSWNKSMKIDKICEEILAPFGIKIINEIGDLGEKVQGFTIDSGESVFDIIKRLCDMRSILPIADIQGNLVFSSPGKSRSTDSIVYGVNVESASSTFSFMDRFKQYIVKGSRTSEGTGWDKSNVQVVGTATDPQISRYRPKVIVSDRRLSTKLAQNKARWEAQVRAGKSAEVIVTLPNWRQSDGTLWRENLMTIVDLEPLKIKQAEMVVVQVTYNYGLNGTSINMSLRRPDIYKADPSLVVQKRKKSSQAGWERTSEEVSDAEDFED